MDLYPSTIHEAYSILQRCEENHPNPHVENEGVSFAQNGRGCDLSMLHATAVIKQGTMLIHPKAQIIVEPAVPIM